MAELKKFKRDELYQLIEQWKSPESIDLDVPVEYRHLRERLLSEHENIKEMLGIQSVKGREYQYDLRFALKLYSILNREMSLAVCRAAADEFWIFLGVKVFPDLVFWRGGAGAHSRFYSQSRRIWLKSLWWYVYLSWQGSEESTFKVLEHNSTDEIVQLVERSGTKGYRIELCRAIMKHYGQQDIKLRSRGSKLFRRVMKLNTARLAVLEPALYERQEQGYVEDLFYEVQTS